MENKLSEIQALVKVPKNNFNAFGKYHYRSAEDILEHVKPILHKLGFSITCSDKVLAIGERFYIEATATITDGKITYQTTALAREDESKKGMDGSQITGSASSYARKYALNGLFAIDDTKDADSTNTHGKQRSLEQWKSMVEACTLKQELDSLYFEHSNEIGNNKDILALFSQQKQLINGSIN